MSETRPSLLALVEFLGHTGLRHVYERAGFAATLEFTVRKANTLMRKLKPQVIVADFYFQPDFRDRVSNVESLLATAQGLAEPPRIVILYDPAHQAALEKVRQRFRIDAVLTVPVRESDLEAALRSAEVSAA